MTKSSDGNPLRDNSPYSDILGVDPSIVKEKVRRGAEEGHELLTSNDLFGEILSGFKTAEGSPRGSAPRPPNFESAGTDPFTPATTKPEEGGKGYSLLDAAYSTLLKDSHLHKDVERIEKLTPPATAPEESSDYGRYSLLERVATGGMAEVFRAKRKGVEGFEKTVAVKRILPHLSSNKEFVEMFVAEAKMVASLSHPNIVQIFDLGKIDDTYYIAMEFVEGVDLRTVLTRARTRNTLPGVDLAALIAARVSAALEYAHRQRDGEGRELRIVHRDVSPQNILISDEGEVKLVDFGIAKAATKASHTDSGSLRGKLLYMSPEQAWGKPLDKRSDLFALGAVFYEILTGHLLFSASSEMSVLERVREARFVSPSSLNPAVPIELEAVAMRLLNKNPAERYQDASEVLLELDSYLRRRPPVGSGDLSRYVKKLFQKDA
jgi:serine/threonine protein kinase